MVRPAKSRHAAPRSRRVTAERFRLNRIAADPEAARVFALVAATTLVAPEDLVSRSRGTAHTSFARQLAMYLMRVIYSRTFQQIGNLVGRDAGTASHACMVIETKRDDSDFEQFISALETQLETRDVGLREVRYASVA